MSYATIIVTQKEANNNIDEDICLKHVRLLKNRILEFQEKENMYFILTKSEFSTPYYPAMKKKCCSDKEIFIKALNNINIKCVLKEILFICLGEDETIHKIEKCNLDDIVSLIHCDNIQANVLYKIKHNYLDFYNK